MPFKDITKKREYNRLWARKRRDERGCWPPPRKGWAQWSLEYRLKNPERYLYTLAKQRAKRKKLEFDLEISDIIIPDFCPVLGIKLGIHTGYRKENSASIDRVDNERGYTKDNIIVMSFKANRMKSNFTLDELEQLVFWLKEPRLKYDNENEAYESFQVKESN